MHRKYNQVLYSIIFILDLILVALSWLLAYHIRFNLQPLVPVTKGYPPLIKYIHFLPFIILVYALCFRFFKTNIITRARLSKEELSRLIQVNSIALMLVAALTFFYRDYSYSRMVMVYFWCLNTLLLAGVRWAFVQLLPWLRQKGYYGSKRIAIVGTGELAQTIARRIIDHPELGFTLVGFITDGSTQGLGELLGTVEDMPGIIQRNAIDQIYIALPLNNQQLLEGIMDSLREELVDVKVVPDFLRFMQLNAGIEDLDGIPVISLRESPLIGWNRFFKRCFDLVISSIAILLLLPLMLLIALIIKITSKGPVLYKQERCGLDNKPFMMYKFRTMVVDAEKTTGPIWAQRNDSRCTPFGSLLRRTSLDELPQFFNVLKGEMSLVGPRPERPVFVEQFKKSIPQYMLRHKMKAGITGWAQVNGWRGNTSLEKRIEYDLYYIEHWSLLFDLKILWLTLWKGLINKNAY